MKGTAMSEQTLEAVQSSAAQEPSAPAADDKVKAEQPAEKAAPDGANGEGDTNGEQAPAKELTEAEKTRAAMQKRIDRQTAANKAQQESISKLTAELNAIKAATPKKDDAPKQDDFASYDEWEKATIDYHAKQRADEILAGEKEKQLKEAQERQAAETRRQFDEKEAAFRNANTDYDTVAGEAASLITELAHAGANIAPLRNMVMVFDNPPEMIYQLGKNPALIEELVGHEPLKLMRELVKFEMTFRGTAQAEAKKVPDPIKPLGGKGGSSKSLDQQSGRDILDWVKKK
jgi:chemotaxis protein histidine kinase CheA